MPSALRKQRDQARKQRTRQLLLDAAGRVLAAKGYHQTLISDIVAAAGVGQGTFYRFFDSKRSVFDTLLDRFFEQLIAEFSEMSATPLTDLDAYRNASLAAVRKVAARLDEQRDLTLLFLRETSSVDREAALKLAAMLDQFAFYAKLYLDQAMAQGFARPCDSAVVAQALVGIGLHLIRGWFEGRFGELTADDLSEQIVDFAFLGIGGVGSRSGTNLGVGHHG